MVELTFMHMLSMRRVRLDRSQNPAGPERTNPAISAHRTAYSLASDPSHNVGTAEEFIQ